MVGEVELRLPPGEDPAPLRPLIAVQAGQPLTPEATQRTVRGLYLTGKFAGVEVITFPAGGEPEAPRVRVEVRCTPRRAAASVKVEGRGGALPVSGAALLQAASLPIGSEIYAGRLEASARAMRELLARHGYRQARVTPEEKGGVQVDVTFAIDAGEPTRVSAVTIGPSPGLPEELLRRDIQTRPGEILDEETLEADLRSVRDALRKGGWYRARVGSPRVTVDGQQARVDFPVEAGPHFTFRFTGETPFGAAQLRERLGYEGDVPLDATTIEGAAERLQAFLAAFGFSQARVWTEEVPEGSTEVTVWFHADPGREYRLREVRFAGATHHDDDWLRKRLTEGFALAPKVEVNQWRADLDSLAWRSGLATRDPVPYRTSDPGDVFNAEAWRVGTQYVAEQYRDDGFLGASVEVRRIAFAAAAGWVDVEVQVKEGVRTRVEAVVIDGNEHVSRETLLAAAKIEPDAPLSLAQVAVSRQSLQAAYVRAGYIYARVEGSPEFNADQTRANVRFRIEEGPQVRVAGVVVTGNKRTRTALIERVVGFQVGQVFDPEMAASAQTDLLRLGVFRAATIHLADPDVPQVSKTLLVQVEERPWQSVVGTLGLSLAEGPRAGAEYDLPNLYGNAIGFQARAKANYPLAIFRPDLVVIPPPERLEWLGELGLRQPRAFDLRSVALRADLVAQHKIQAAYQLLRGALILGADLIRLGRLSASLTGQLEVDEVTTRTAYPIIDATNPQEARQVFPQGLTWLFSIQPRVSFDLRDNAARPTQGIYAEVTADFSHSIGTPDTVFRSDTHVDLIKLQGTLTGYVPLWGMVLALSAQAGQVFPLDTESVTIAPKRFYLGGATTMRGYGENEMIPQDQRGVVAAQTERCASVLSGLGCSPQLQKLVQQGIMLPSQGAQMSVLFRAELRVPLSKATELGFFADIGNLWFDPSLVDLTKIRTNLGFGFRIITPVGPAAFDVGFNLNPEYRINEPIFAPHFAVGFF